MKTSNGTFVVSCLLALAAMIALHFVWDALGIPMLIRILFNSPVCYMIIHYYNKHNTLNK